MKITILYIVILLFIFGCQTENAPTVNSKEEIIELNPEEKETNTSEIPRVIYVKYGKFCGECGTNCTQMYHHFLIGNITTFWTDKTDSYFSKSGLKCETEMSRESQKISFELINHIPKSIITTDSTKNVFGCPDCDDGCGLYFEFQLDTPNAKPVVFIMENSLNNTSGEIKEFGERIKRTIEQLKKYR
jgi:hypothetical protein